MLRVGGRIGQVALQRDSTSVAESVSSSEQDSSKLASAFSKRIGLTLCGIVEEPVALDGHLGEHATGDVHPHVHAQVVHDAVRVGDGRVELGLPVVAFDLRGQRVPGQAHAVRDELAGDSDPVDIRACGQVGTERAGRAVDLAQVLLVFDVLELTVQTVDVDGELLAECGRRGRLAWVRESSGISLNSSALPAR